MSVLILKNIYSNEKIVEAAEYRNNVFYGDDGKPANWWADDGKDWYFFQNGKKFTGYGKDASGKKYFVNGKYANWWTDDGEAWYFFQEGEKFTGTAKDASGYRDFKSGKYSKDTKNKYKHGLFFDSEGDLANWWSNDGKAWYFFQNGKKHTGYGEDASGKKYFDNGKYANWWYDDSKGWYFFQNGVKYTGYGEDASGKKYFDEGKYANWWYNDGKDWYFFQEGKKHTGYGKDASGKKYFDEGKYANWWCNDGEDWYFFQDGKKFTGRAKDASGYKNFINGKYVKTENGYIDGVFYTKNGELANGWYDDGYDWYFFQDGKKYSGYGTDGNGKRYFYEGKYTNGWYDDGYDWYFFQDGEKFTGRAKDESGYRDFLNGKYKKQTYQSEFIDKISPGVLKAIEGKGLFPSIAVAQACLETGYGTDSLSPPPIYNLFGIKAANDTPPSRYYEIRTAEYKNGKKYYIIAKFMKFTGYDEAFEYYAKLFTKNKWLTEYYSGVLAAKTPDEAARALTGTYATDPNYGQKLLDIIEKHGLRSLDKKIYPNGVKP